MLSWDGTGKTSSTEREGTPGHYGMPGLIAEMGFFTSYAASKLDALAVSLIAGWSCMKAIITLMALPRGFGGVMLCLCLCCTVLYRAVPVLYWHCHCS